MSKIALSRLPGEGRDPGAKGTTCPPADPDAEPAVVLVTLGPGLRREGGEVAVPFQPGQSLMQAIAAQGRDAITALCGGCCVCGTCRVRVLDGDPGPMAPAEAALHRQLGITDPAIRLSCQMWPDACLRVAVIHPR